MSVIPYGKGLKQTALNLEFLQDVRMTGRKVVGLLVIFKRRN